MTIKTYLFKYFKLFFIKILNSMFENTLNCCNVFRNFYPHFIILASSISSVKLE